MNEEIISQHRHKIYLFLKSLFIFFRHRFRVRIYAMFKEYTCIVVSIYMLYIHCVLSVRTHAHSYKHSATLKEY